MKRVTIAIASLTLSLITCCVLASLFWDGYYLPKKPCRPITYPDAMRTTEAFSITSQDSLETVLDFYNQNLDTKPLFVADTGDWKMEEISNNRYLFSCYGADINLVDSTAKCNFESR